MSLLNLPSAMKMYGPLVNLWEGKLMGEAIVKYCKSEMDNGLRGNWAMNVLLKHYRKRALKRLTEDSGNDVEEEEDDGNDNLMKTSEDPEAVNKGGADELTAKRKGRRAFKRYDTYSEAEAAFLSGEPLSVLDWKSGDDLANERYFGMVFGSKKEELSVAVLESISYAKGTNLVRYTKWSMNGDYLPFAQMQTNGVLLPVVFLPMHKEIIDKQKFPNREPQDRSGYYTVVSSEWKQHSIDF